MINLHHFFYKLRILKHRVLCFVKTDNRYHAEKNDTNNPAPDGSAGLIPQALRQMRQVKEEQRL